MSLARYRAEDDRTASFEQLARSVILRRAKLDLSQTDLARHMGMTASVVSRIERGQHAASVRTLKRRGEALDGRAAR